MVHAASGSRRWSDGSAPPAPRPGSGRLRDPARARRPRRGGAGGATVHVVAEAFDAAGTVAGPHAAAGAGALRAHLRAPGLGGGRAAEHGVAGVGALDAVAAFGLDEVEKGAAEAGIVVEGVSPIRLRPRETTSARGAPAGRRGPDTRPDDLTAAGAPAAARDRAGRPRDHGADRLLRPQRLPGRLRRRRDHPRRRVLLRHGFRLHHRLRRHRPGQRHRPVDHHHRGHAAAADLPHHLRRHHDRAAHRAVAAVVPDPALEDPRA